MSAVQFDFRVMRRGWLVASLTASIAAVHQPRTASDPGFVPGPCPPRARNIAGIDSTWVNCGTVTVPQDRANPNSKKLAPVVLSVVVYEAPSARSKTPLVFLAGGPGEPAIDVVTEVFLPSPVGQLTLRERPIIAFNQRGIGDSSSGASPILGTLAYHWRATRDESIETLVDSAHKIVTRLRASGIKSRELHDASRRSMTRATSCDRSATSICYSSRRRTERSSPCSSCVSTRKWSKRASSTVSRRHRASIPSTRPLLDRSPPRGRRRLIDDCEKSSTCSSEYRELREVATALDRNDVPPVHIVVHLPVRRRMVRSRSPRP